MMGFIDHLSDGQFGALCVVIVTLFYLAAGEGQQWLRQRRARRYVAIFAADHRRERLGYQLAAGAGANNRRASLGRSRSNTLPVGIPPDRTERNAQCGSLSRPEDLR